MKEIEILVQIYDDLEKVEKTLSQFKYIKTKKVIDEYFYDPKRDNFKPKTNNRLTECLRIRRSNNECLITYKDDVFDGDKWLYSNEYETKVDSYNMITKILKKIGMKKLIEVENEKKIYNFLEYEISFENVTNLGLFLEVEYCTDDEIDVKKKKKEIQEFINSLNLSVSDELNMGKPEMILNKNEVKII